MGVLTAMVSALSLLISVGCVLRSILLGIHMAMDTDGDKRQYKNQIKSVIIVFIISLVVGGSVLTILLTKYFSP